MSKAFRRGLATLLLGAWLPGSALGRDDNALRFDGVDDRAQLPLPAVFGSLATQDVSFSARVRPEAAPATARIFFAQQAVDQFASLLLTQGSDLTFYVRIGNNTYSARSDGQLSPGRWSHVTATWNAAELRPRIYVNGEEQFTLPGGSSSSGLDGVMTLGSRTDGLQPFPGALDDVRLWPTTLAPSQVRAEALSTCGASMPLLASFDFDVGSGGGDNTGLTALPDVSGVGSHAMLVNFALTGTDSNWIASSARPPSPALVFDPPLPAVLATTEAGGGYNGTLALAAPAATEVSVSFGFDDDGEASASSASLVFTPNAWNIPQPITILGLDDAEFDGPRDFTVSISAQDEEACYGEVALDISGVNGDDESARVTATGAMQVEGNATADEVIFELQLDTAVPGGFSLAYATTDGTAAAGSDYVASSGSVQFAGLAGEVQQVAVPLLGNLEAGPDRRFSLMLGTATVAGVSVLPDRVEAVIVDDDLDVSVLLDNGVDDVSPGQGMTYVFAVHNLSPGLSASAMEVGFSTTPPLQDLRWSCAGFGGATCTSGSGASLAQTVVLPPAATIVYAINGALPPAYAGDLVATAAAWPGNDADSQPQDNVAIDIDLGPVLFENGFE